MRTKPLAAAAASLATLACAGPAAGDTVETYPAVQYTVTFNGDGKFNLDEHLGQQTYFYKPDGADTKRHIDAAYGFAASYEPLWIPTVPNAPKLDLGAKAVQFTGGANTTGSFQGGPLKKPPHSWSCTGPVGAQTSDHDPHPAPFVFDFNGRNYTLQLAPAGTLEIPQDRLSCSEPDRGDNFLLFGVGDEDPTDPTDFGRTVKLPSLKKPRATFALPLASSTQAALQEGRQDPDNCKLSGEDHQCSWSQSWSGSLEFKRVCEGKVKFHNHKGIITSHVGKCGKAKPRKKRRH
jgi:hypothetical protein